MTAGLFVTGTDTECGKTHVARALITLLRDQGVRVAGFKPVAAGAVEHDGHLRNDDALTLSAASGLQLPYDLVNPYCFVPPIAPHLAAAAVGEVIDRHAIRAAFSTLAGRVDVVIAEGAGGWLVPLGEGFDMAMLAGDLGLPVVLVVGLRLGCINHARLTERAIRASGVRLAGWVGTQIDPAMRCVDENVTTLVRELESPCLAVLPHAVTPCHGKPLTSREIMAEAGLRGA